LESLGYQDISDDLELYFDPERVEYLTELINDPAYGLASNGPGGISREWPRYRNVYVLTAFGFPGHSIIAFEDKDAYVTTFEKYQDGKIYKLEWDDLKTAIKCRNGYWQAKFNAMKVEEVSSKNIIRMYTAAEKRNNTNYEGFSLLNYNCSTFVSDILNAGGVNVRSNNPNLLWVALLRYNNVKKRLKELKRK
jgi:hypothetical protein